MTNVISVRLGDEEVATLTRRRGELELRYVPAYIELANAVPMSLTLPLTGVAHRGSAVSRYLDNLLPDNSEVRDGWARSAGLQSADPFDLLGVYGGDVAGAFSYHAGQTHLDDQVDLSQGEIANIIRSLRENAASWQPSAAHGKFSLAGAQAKTSLHYDGIRWSITSGRLPSTHILKPEIPGYLDSDLVEHVTMFAAGRVGIATAKTWIGTFANERTLVVERFDRSRDLSGSLLRVHQEDLAQAMGLSRLQKYQSDGGPTPEQVLALLGSTGAQWAANANKVDYLKQLAFHWMVCGTDAHAKNYSIFLLADNHLLTPLYDAMSFLPYINATHSNLKKAIRSLSLSANIGVGYSTDSAGAFEWAGIARKARVPGFDLVEWMRATSSTLTHEIASECDRQLASYDSDVLREYKDRALVRHELAMQQLK